MTLAYRNDSSSLWDHRAHAFMNTFENYWACGFASGLALN